MMMCVNLFMQMKILVGSITTVVSLYCTIEMHSARQQVLQVKLALALDLCHIHATQVVFKFEEMIFVCLCIDERDNQLAYTLIVT